MIFHESITEVLIVKNLFALFMEYFRFKQTRQIEFELKKREIKARALVLLKSAKTQSFDFEREKDKFFETLVLLKTYFKPRTARCFEYLIDDFIEGVKIDIDQNLEWLEDDLDYYELPPKVRLKQSSKKYIGY